MRTKRFGEWLTWILGLPPLLGGKDAPAYAELQAKIFGIFRPSDVIERARVRDVIDITVAILKLRRLKTNIPNFY
jgi:hypothetical protein